MMHFSKRKLHLKRLRVNEPQQRYQANAVFILTRLRNGRNSYQKKCLIYFPRGERRKSVKQKIQNLNFTNRLDNSRQSWTGLKKNLNYSSIQKRLLIEGKNREITIYRQCELIMLARSGYYYKPRAVGSGDIEVMHLIDEQYTKTPFYGIRRIIEVLHRLGYIINHKRIARLMRIMGLEAIYPRPRYHSSAKYLRLFFALR